MSVLIEKMHPQLVPMFEGFVEECLREGIPTRVIMTKRTVEEQDRIYAIGRTIELHRRPVTKARGYQSYHVWLCAMDLVPERVLPFPDWLPNAPEWVELARVAKALGIEHDVPNDLAHFDYKEGGHWRRWRDEFPNLVLPSDIFKRIP